MTEMLDAWIIEEIRRREEREQWEDRPYAELPLHPPPSDEHESREEEEERGVVIIDFRV